MFSDNAEKNLTAWRNFRRSFKGSEEECIAAFKGISVQPRYIDYYTPESWPKAFEIVASNMMCQSGLTITIAATLLDLGFINSDEIELQVVSNHVTGTEGLVLKHDSKIYNFLPGEVVDEDFCNENSTTYDSYIIAVDKLV